MLDKTWDIMNRSFIVVIAFILIVIVVSVVIFFGPSLQGDALDISDPRGDVLLSVGSACPGMMDLVGANFTRSNGLANITVKVGEPFVSLGPDESASWEILVVLENETSVLRTYVVRVEADLAGFRGSFWDVMVEDVETFQTTRNGQWLSIMVDLDDLQSASMIEWNIQSVYTVFSGNDVVTDAYDMAPDQGIQTTMLEP